MTAGLILVIPIWITILLIGFVFGMMRDASLWMVEAMLKNPWATGMLRRIGVSAEDLSGGAIETLPLAVRWGLGALAVLLTVLVLYFLGMVTTNIAGRRIVHAVEALVDRLPLVKTIYRASKQVLETFAGESAQSFQRVVSVPFPSPQVRTIGFVTRVIRDATPGEELCSVFVATVPNPTTGYVFLVKRRHLVELNWTVEEALKVILSGGVLLPEGPLPMAEMGPASSVSA